MGKARKVLAAALVVTAVVLSGCSEKQKVPSFSLAWSEYPSWSTFGVAHEIGIINGKKGEMGPIEQKWGVDIELKEADYDACIVMYAAGQCDAACLTNMDVLNPSLGRHSVGIMPTSTSYGADALLVPEEIKDITELRGKNVYGLKKTVSEYCFVRNLEEWKPPEKEEDHRFTNMDPGAAALAFVQGKLDYIVVWNPFVIECLNKRKGTKRLFDSTKIPGEIVDMVQMAQDSLKKPGAEAFTHAVMDTFYEISRRLENPETREQTLLRLGEKFARVDAKMMADCCEQTIFYATPEAGLKLLVGDEWVQPREGAKFAPCDPFKKINERVASFCISHNIVPKEPKLVIAYGDERSVPDPDKVHWRVDPSYLRNYLAKSKAK